MDTSGKIMHYVFLYCQWYCTQWTDFMVFFVLENIIEEGRPSSLVWLRRVLPQNGVPRRVLCSNMWSNSVGFPPSNGVRNKLAHKQICIKNIYLHIPNSFLLQCHWFQDVGSSTLCYSIIGSKQLRSALFATASLVPSSYVMHSSAVSLKNKMYYFH